MVQAFLKVMRLLVVQAPCSITPLSQHTLRVLSSPRIAGLGIRLRQRTFPINAVHVATNPYGLAHRGYHDHCCRLVPRIFALPWNAPGDDMLHLILLPIYIYRQRFKAHFPVTTLAFPVQIFHPFPFSLQIAVTQGSDTITLRETRTTDIFIRHVEIHQIMYKRRITIEALPRTQALWREHIVFNLRHERARIRRGILRKGAAGHHHQANQYAEWHGQLIAKASFQTEQ